MTRHQSHKSLGSLTVHASRARRVEPIEANLIAAPVELEASLEKFYVLICHSFKVIRAVIVAVAVATAVGFGAVLPRSNIY